MRRSLPFLSSAILVILFFSACIPTYRAPMSLPNVPSPIQVIPHYANPGDLAIDGNGIIHIARLQCIGGTSPCSLVYEQYLLGSRLLQRVIPPAVNRSASNPQLVIDPTGKVHLAWEECSVSVSYTYCPVMYRRMVPDSEARKLGTSDMGTEPEMMRMVTNGDLPEEAIITRPAVFIVFGGYGVNDGIRDRLCSVSLESTAGVTCMAMGYTVPNNSNLTKVAAAVARDGTLAFAFARQDYGYLYRVILSTPLDHPSPGQVLMTRSSSNYYGFDELRVAFDYDGTNWNLYELGVARGPTYSTWEPVLRRCRQQAYLTCTSSSTPIDYSVLMPNSISGADLAVMPNGVPTIVFTGWKSVDVSKSTYIYTSTCPMGVSPCALFPLERPINDGWGDSNPHLFMLDGYMGTVWQRANVPTVGDLTLHHIGTGFITIPRSKIRSTNSPYFAFDVEGSLAAAMWVSKGDTNDTPYQTWLVYNAGQTSLPIALK